MTKALIVFLVTILSVFQFSTSFANKISVNRSGPNLRDGDGIHEAVAKTDSIRTIAFYLQDGVEVLDFAGPMEVFVYAGYKVFTVSKTKAPIVSQGVLKVLPDYDLSDAPEADMLVFFGGNSGSAFRDKELIDWVKNRKSRYYFSVCTGVFALAEAGILNGHNATTFHSALDDLEQGFPGVAVLKGVRFVDNGKVITTAGISAGIDGALHIVAKFQGFGQAKRVAYYMEYDNWKPGNGVLSGRNPYLMERTGDDFLEYAGTYDFAKNSKMLIQRGTKGELSVSVENRQIPLFYDRKDIFLNGDGKRFSFMRDNTGKVSGLTIEGFQDLFRKTR